MNFIRIILASALALGLAACNDGQKQAQEAADAAAKAAAAVASQGKA